MDEQQVREGRPGARFVEPHPEGEPFPGQSVWEVEGRGLRCVESSAWGNVDAFVPFQDSSAEGLRLGDLAPVLRPAEIER